MPRLREHDAQQVLLDLMSDNLRTLGPDGQQRTAARTVAGSTDFGNVSRRVPGHRSAHRDHRPVDVPGHSIEFREAAGSELGRQAMLAAAKSLAMTAIDLLGEPDLAQRARSSTATWAAPRRAKLHYQPPGGEP